MEPKRMRRVLAELIGEPSRMGVVTWYTSEEGTDYRIRNADCKLPTENFDWHPDTDPAQAWLVIEAMRRKAWKIDVHMGVAGYHVRFYRGDDREEAFAKTFPEAISLAAYRALEPPNG